MATDKAQIVSDYPLPGYNYRVTIDGNETMSFSEVSGLTAEYEQIIYKHGFSWVMGENVIRGQRKLINITLKRGVVKNRDYLFKWLKSESAGSGKKKDLKIDLCDETGTPIVSWEVKRAMPVKLESPSFSAESKDVAIESMDLIAYDIKLNYHS